LATVSAVDLLGAYFHDCGVGPEPADYPPRSRAPKKFVQDPRRIRSLKAAVEFGMVCSEPGEDDNDDEVGVLPVVHPTRAVYTPQVRAVLRATGDLDVSAREFEMINLEGARSALLTHDYQGYVLDSTLVVEGNVAYVPRNGLSLFALLFTTLLNSKQRLVPRAEADAFLAAARAMASAGTLRFELIEGLDADPARAASTTSNFQPVARLTRTERGWQLSFRARYGGFFMAPDFEPDADLWEAGGEWAASVPRDRAAEALAVNRLKALLGPSSALGRWPINGDNVDAFFSRIVRELGAEWIIEVPQREYYDPATDRVRRSKGGVMCPAYRSTRIYDRGDQAFDQQAEQDYLYSQRDQRTLIALDQGGVPIELAKAVKRDVVEAERPAAELERLPSQPPLWTLAADWLKRVAAVQARDRLRARAAMQSQIERLADIERVDLAPVDAAAEKVTELLAQSDAELRPHQSVALHMLLTRALARVNTVLTHPMGEGKTLTGLMFAHALNESGLARGPILWVGPPSGIQTFVAEHDRFCPTLRVRAYAGPGRHLRNLRRGQIVYCTFDVAARDAGALAEAGFSAMVVDEFSNAKSPSSARHKALSQIRGTTEHVLLLNGTPIETSLGDLGAHLELLAPRAFWTPAWWTSVTQAVDDGDHELLQLAQRAFRAYVVGIEECGGASAPPPLAIEAELPPVRPSALHTRVIDQLLMNSLRRARETQSSEHLLGDLMHIRQACDDASVVKTLITKCDEAPKVDVAASLVMSAAKGGDRTLVFSRFLAPLRRLERLLTAQGLRVEWYTGETPLARRQAVVHAWSNPRVRPTAVALLMTLGAGARGLNLQGANNVIVLEPDWNPAVIEQAVKRAHRSGQTRTVTVNRLILDHEVEERIQKRADQRIWLRSVIGAHAESTQAEPSWREVIEELAASVRQRASTPTALAVSEPERVAVLNTACSMVRDGIESAMKVPLDQRKDFVTNLLLATGPIMTALKHVEEISASASELVELQRAYDRLIGMSGED